MSASRRIAVIALFFALFSLAFSQSAAPKAAPAKAASAKAADAGVALHAFFDSEWEYGLEQSPLFASFLGDRRWNDKLGDASLAASAKDLAHTQQAIKKL